MTMSGVVLSLFPGIGLLDLAFELEGFCVVRGPDLLWGGDVRRFIPPAGVFSGIIGGPPCQEFSALNRDPAPDDGVALLEEFIRVTGQARPVWWLLENVARVPDVVVPGYTWQRLDVDQGWYCGVRRLRHIQFGALGLPPLQVPAGRVVDGAEPAALACDGRSVDELRRLQGLPEDFTLPGLTVEAQKRAIGNGVPLVMGRVLARAVRRVLTGEDVGALIPSAVVRRFCACGCGREVRGRRLHAGVSCRKRAQRRRDSSRPAVVTTMGLPWVPGQAAHA